MCRHCSIAVECACSMHLALTANSDGFLEERWLCLSCNVEAMCFLWGTIWFLKVNLMRFLLQRRLASQYWPRPSYSHDFQLSYHGIGYKVTFSIHTASLNNYEPTNWKQTCEPYIMDFDQVLNHRAISGRSLHRPVNHHKVPHFYVRFGSFSRRRTWRERSGW